MKRSRIDLLATVSAERLRICKPCVCVLERTEFAYSSCHAFYRLICCCVSANIHIYINLVIMSLNEYAVRSEFWVLDYAMHSMHMVVQNGKYTLSSSNRFVYTMCGLQYDVIKAAEEAHYWSEFESLSICMCIIRIRKSN